MQDINKHIDFELEKRITHAAVEISTILMLLFDKGIITEDDYIAAKHTMLEQEDVKSTLEKLEYGSNIEKIVLKGGLLSAEDEKYIRKNNKWDSADEVDKMIEDIKMVSLLDGLLNDEEGE